MWQRHRLMIPYAAAAFVTLVAVAVAVGFDDWATRIALGAGGSAIAVAATTDYRVLAATSRGLVLFRASRIRQWAVEPIETLDAEAEIMPIGGFMFAADWKVGPFVYTVPRSSEQAIGRIAAAR